MKKFIALLLTLVMILSLVPSAAFAATKKTTKAKAPRLHVTNTATGISLKWTKVSGATRYVVYRNGKKLKTVSKKATFYTDKKRTNGKKYTYKVKAVKKGKDLVSAPKTMYRLVRPTITSAVSKDPKKITVKWKKNSKASGYQIKYTAGSTSKTVKVKGASTLHKILSSLKKDKTYKIRVRSYKTVSGKTYYSAWSAAKSRKTHAHSYTAKAVAATCNSKGYTVHTCSCGDSYKDSYKDALGHSWKEEYKSVTVDDYETKCVTRCSVCNADLTGQNVGLHGRDHALAGEGAGSYETYEDMKVGSHTEKELIGYTCSRCGASK